MKPIRNIIVSLVALLAFGSAFAVPPGSIYSIDWLPSAPQLRVKITGQTNSYCGVNIGTEAQLSKTDPNYDEWSRVLRGAQITGTVVALTLTNVGGYCQITGITTL